MDCSRSGFCMFFFMINIVDNYKITIPHYLFLFLNCMWRYENIMLIAKDLWLHWVNLLLKMTRYWSLMAPHRSAVKGYKLLHAGYPLDSQVTIHYINVMWLFIWRIRTWMGCFGSRFIHNKLDRWFSVYWRAKLINGSFAWSDSRHTCFVSRFAIGRFG